MKIFDRYIIAELFPFTLVGLAVISFIILINQIVVLAGFLIRNSVSIWVLLKIIFNLIPSAIIFGIPMSILVGTILAIGRLSAESEITAFRACGINIIKFIKPILIFTIFAFIMDILVSVYWLPDSNDKLVKLYRQIIASRTITGQVKPRVFFERISNKVLYITQTQNNNRVWKDVIIFDTSKAYEPSLIMAKKGVPHDEDAEKGLMLTLEDATIYDINLNDPIKKSRMSRTPSMLIQLAEQKKFHNLAIQRAKSDRAMNIKQLQESVKQTFKQNQIIFHFYNHTEELKTLAVTLTIKDKENEKDYTSSFKLAPNSMDKYSLYFTLPKKKNLQSMSLKVVSRKANGIDDNIYNGTMTGDKIREMVNRNEAVISHNNAFTYVFPDAKGNKDISISQVKIKNIQFRRPHEKYLVEIHKKFSIPFSCLIFGLLGLPLGITSRRAGKSFGYVTSVLIFTSYWYLLINAEIWGDKGKVSPFLGAWFANFIFLAFAVILLIRMGKPTKGKVGELFNICITSIKNFSQKYLSQLKKSVFSKKEKSSASVNKQQSTSSSIWQNRQGTRVVLQIPRYYFRFPNILDRYIIKTFIKLFLMSLLVLYIISMIIQFTEINDDFQAKKSSYTLLWDYYKYRLPSTMLMLIPISSLIATLATFGVLSRNNETIAMKAAGVSQYRMALSIIVLAIIFSGITYNINENVIPQSKIKFDEVERKIKKLETQTIEQPRRQFLFGESKGDNVSRIYYFYRYNEQEKTFDDISYYDYNRETMTLVQRLAAKSSEWEDHYKGWLFRDGWIQKYTPQGFMTEEFQNRIQRLDETPDYFKKTWRRPDQMDYQELKKLISEIKSKGLDPVYEQVNLHWKMAYALVTFVVVMIGIPFSFRMDNKGSLAGIFIALVIILIFYPMTNIFRHLGYSGVLPPTLAAWAGNLIFVLVGLIFLTRMRT
ncbi:MAG: LptF/LptG family permease [Acidobacteria bacterium]|nr:LptF/LptG family permease [Acidobacteriota bacterium]